MDLLCVHRNLANVSDEQERNKRQFVVALGCAGGIQSVQFGVISLSVDVESSDYHIGSGTQPVVYGYVYNIIQEARKYYGTYTKYYVTNYAK